MKALTVHQPWAWLIVNGYKTIENRTRRTSHRGPLLIHAGLTPEDPICWTFTEMNARRIGAQLPAPHELPFGAIVGIVHVVEVLDPCEQSEVHKWRWRDPYMYGWVLEGAVAVPEPVTWRGMPGLFEVPDEVVAEALGQGQAQPVHPGGVL